LAAALNLYVNELLFFNPTHGLIGLREGVDARRQIERHLVDCLAAAGFFWELKPATLADVGSGAGLPGIPLALLLPDCRVSLIETKGRRCDFLRSAVALLGLKDRVEILQEPLKNVRRVFDLVTCRAFAPLSREGRGLLAITRPGGKLAAYKGRAEVFAEEMAGFESWTSRRLVHPFLEGERFLVVVEKS
jgi:16S rRNA (guanine527-N7)-methyltransferase